LSAALRSVVHDLGSAAERICLVQDVPVLAHAPPHGLVRVRRLAVEEQFLHVDDAAWRDRQAGARAALAEFAGVPGVTVVDPGSRLCGPEGCRIEHDGEVLYRDSNHLSVAGALYVSDSLAGCFDDRR
jgi:hypothetical protein